jgi:hypothetical protein
VPNYLIQPAADHTADPDDVSNAVLAMDIADPGVVSGLTNGTAYVAREFVLSPASSEFTPVAPAATNFAFVNSAGEVANAATYTFDDTDITGLDFTDGGKFLVLVASHSSNNTAADVEPTGVTIGGETGVAAEPGGGYPLPASAIGGAVTAWVATVSAAATEEIVVSRPSGATWSGCSVSVYQIDGYNVRAVAVDWDTNNPTSVDLSTESGSPVLLGIQVDDAPSPATNISVDATLGAADASGDLTLGERWAVWSDADAAATETKSYAFSAANGNNRYAITLVGLEVA